MLSKTMILFEIYSKKVTAVYYFGFHSSLIPEMADFEQTFLRTAITEVLPDLPEMQKDILEENLQSLGVETYDDIQFIHEADLLSVLRPIQARKVLAAWKLSSKSSTAHYQWPK